MKKKYFLEKDKRFSESMIWELQQRAYCDFGQQAWTQKGVPSYITSNPFTVRSYAQIALGYLRDCCEANNFNYDEPFYIFDLGAGTGRFCFLFLKTFLPMLKGSIFKKVKIKYILTDIAEKNISSWQKHPYLKPLIKKNIIDFAYFHHLGSSVGITLRLSHKTLNKEDIRNPILLIANYFFDTVPQDLFKIQQGILHEGKISLSVKDKKMVKNDPAIIGQMVCDYNYTSIRGNYYKNKTANDLLKSYLKAFDKSIFLLPVGGMSTIEYFKKLSGSRLCLIAGDQGVTTDSQIKNWGEPKISRHGTFSIPVSYHALAKFFEIQKGQGFLTDFSDPNFVVMVGLFGDNRFVETHLAFDTFFNYFQPSDYWTIVNQIEKECQDPSLELMFLLLKLGNWDPMVFNSFYEKLRKKIPG